MIITCQLATGKWFYTHGLEAMLIIGATFTLIGFFFGYLLWRHYQFHVRRIQKSNEKLRDKVTILEAHQNKIAADLATDEASQDSFTM